MEAIIKENPFNQWITIATVLVLVLLAVAKTYFPKRFLDFLIIPFNNKYLMVYNKDQILTHPFNILISIAQIFSISIFIFISINYLQIDLPFKPHIAFLLLIAFVCLALISKILVQKIIANLFNADALFELYIHKKLSYFNNASIFLLIISIIFNYAITPNRILIYTSLFIFFLINLLGWIKILKHFQKSIFTYLFYFILYLCALEIAPYLIGFKLLVK